MIEVHESIPLGYVAKYEAYLFINKVKAFLVILFYSLAEGGALNNIRPHLSGICPLALNFS